MSVFKRPGSPYYYAEFIEAGHRFCRSTKETTEREALKVERRMREQVRAGAETNRGRGDTHTLSKAFGRYWMERSRELSPKWAAEVERYCEEILRLTLPELTIEGFTDSDVNDFVQARLLEEAGPYAINRALAVWRRVHSVARKSWKVSVQMIDWGEYMSDEAKRLAFFTIEQIRKILELIPVHIALAIEWSVYTGCRLEETYGLTWPEVKLKEAKAEVTAKGGKQHTIWLGPQALDVLGRCDTQRRYVFDGTNRRRHWEGALAKMGLDAMRWHDLRHTHATWLRQAGVPLEVVQRSLGHADLATTMRYAHVADRELQTALHQLPTIVPTTGLVSSIFLVKSASSGTGTDD